jgi:L-asparagine oxygenase
MASTQVAKAVEFTVEPDDAALVERVAREVCAADPDRIDDPAWVDRARDGWDALPLRLRQAVRQFRRDSGPQGCMLLRGVPVEPEETLRPTPKVPESVEHGKSISAAVLVMVACGLGDPSAFAAEKSGALVQNVVPVPGKEEFQGNSGSVLLASHNENAFHPHRPDFLMLLCLRADHDRVAQLSTACIRTVLPLLSEDATEELFSPEFVTEPPPSFGRRGGPTSPHAVLFGAPEDPDIRVDFSATTPLTQRAESALAELERLFGETAFSVKLTPGDLAIVDNRVAVHGRSAFTPRYDGKDRWLRRTFVATDLRRSRDHRPLDGYVLAH